MATPIRVWQYRDIPDDAKRFTHKGKAAVRFKGADGKNVVGYLSDKRPGQCRVRSSTWHGWLRDASGSRRRVSLGTTNKEAAQRKLSGLMAKQEARQQGRHEPSEDHAAIPLADHVEAWERALTAAGATAKHVRQSAACVRRIFDGCGFVFPADLSASRVLEFVASLRTASPVIDPAALQESYTRDELAALLGVEASGVPSLIRRHGLKADGNGKARRFPRDTAATLLQQRAAGCSVKTTNEYLTSAKGFATWMVRDRRILSNPFGHLRGGNAEADRRRERRFLSADEASKLIVAASKSAGEFRGLGGPDRAMYTQRPSIRA
ncbi:MAG TPA: helix-turn-helix domain-containing protein [Gemmataceae bacterium]|jgi:hypothetical protein|nr:helix-turn-helix domain-containing protein [Gemmataceae bacterium]